MTRIDLPISPAERLLRLTKHTWSGMRSRCSSTANASYTRYGGRGVMVCERWENFDNFLTDMGPRPSKLYSLDRIDNDGNYEPSNCRWATREQQANNRRPRQQVAS